MCGMYGLTFTAILNVPPALQVGIAFAVDKCNCYFNFMQHRLLKAELMRRRPGEG